MVPPGNEDIPLLGDGQVPRPRDIVGTQDCAESTGEGNAFVVRIALSR